MADRKYPRHDFWGAGEPDCPPDLKAPNGELCDMRCKVCGDGWRESHDVCMVALAGGPVRAALAELVAVKDIKERAAALHFGGINSDAGEGWEAEWKRLQGDYIERQPKAWAAARAALQDDAGVTMSGSTQIGAPGKSPIGVKGPEHG
jgi:hypothetical protein